MRLFPFIVFELFNKLCIEITNIWSLEYICVTFSFSSIIKILKNKYHTNCYRFIIYILKKIGRYGLLIIYLLSLPFQVIFFYGIVGTNYGSIQDIIFT